MPETDEAARLEITFEGIGEPAVEAVSLLPADHWHGLRPDEIAALKEIGTPDQAIRTRLELWGIDRPQQAAGRLLYGDDILPGSVLHETNLAVNVTSEGVAEMALPAYSVALVELAPREDGR